MSTLGRSQRSYIHCRRTWRSGWERCAADTRWVPGFPQRCGGTTMQVQIGYGIFFRRCGLDSAVSIRAELHLSCWRLPWIIVVWEIPQLPRTFCRGGKWTRLRSVLIHFSSLCIAFETAASALEQTFNYFPRVSLGDIDNLSEAVIML